MIKRNTKIDCEELAHNEAETDVQARAEEREMDERMVGESTHAHTFYTQSTRVEKSCSHLDVVAGKESL